MSKLSPILLLPLLLAACTAPTEAGPDEVDNTANADDSIIGGTAISAEGTGYVNLSGCSGTMITNQWVITAKHCFAADKVPSEINATMGTQSTTGASIVRYPDADVDVSLVKLAEPFTMNGSRYGYRRAFYAGSTASLVGKWLVCTGYGQNTFTGGGGTLRTANLKVDSVSGFKYRMVPNGSSQIQFLGDSGGSCYLDGKLTGVQSTAECTTKPGAAKPCYSKEFGWVTSSVASVPGTWQVGAEEIRAWAKDVAEGGPQRYTAVFRKQNSGEIQAYGWSYEAYRAKYDDLWGKGWRLKLLQPYVVEGQVRYNAVWQPSTEGEIQVYGYTYSDYRAKYDDLWGKGWRLKLIQPYVVGGDVRYTAVFRPSTEGEIQVYGYTYTDYRAKYDDLWGKGWRLKMIQPYVVGGDVRYTAVFRPSYESEIQVYGYTYTDYRAKYDDLWGKGWRLKMIQPYVVGGDVRYTAVFHPSTEGEYQVYGWSYNDYRQRYDDLWSQGYRLSMLSTYVP